jgi:hypothetical protein
LGGTTAPAPTTSFFTGGFGTANAQQQQQQQQQQKTELALDFQPYGKLPDIPLPPPRVRPTQLPTTLDSAKRSSHIPPMEVLSYKVTPKSEKPKLIALEFMSTKPSTKTEIEQRVISELVSPHIHSKRLVLSEEDTEILESYSSRKQKQKEILRERGTNTTNENLYSHLSPPSTPYVAPHKTNNSKPQPKGQLFNSFYPDSDEREDVRDQNRRQEVVLDLTPSSKSKNSYSSHASLSTPIALRASATGNQFKQPYGALSDSHNRDPSKNYSSYLDGMVDNRSGVDVDRSVPVIKCTKPGVKTIPSIETIYEMSKSELESVKNFVVWKEDVGRVEFPGITNISGLDIDRIIEFKEKEIVMYPNDEDKPNVGEGLNKEAIITLFKSYPLDKETFRPSTDPTVLAHYKKKLQKTCRDKWYCDFVSYENGNFTFKFNDFND